MELSVTLDYGPLNAEFQGGDQDEIQENLVEFVNFLEEHKDVIEAIEASTISTGSMGDVDASTTEARTENGGGPSESDAEVDSATGDNPLSPLASRLNKPVEELEELIYVSVENGDLPQLLVDNPDRLGDSVVERQRNVAMVVLLVWEKCYDQTKMKVSDIKDILSMMDISTSHTYRAWEKSYFKQTGTGPASSIQLRGPGERNAYSLLRELLEDSSE